MTNSCDDFYKKSGKVFSTKPTDYVVKAAKLLSGSSTKNALDLGAGQGRDSVYLAQLGFHIVAIDQSSVACRQLNMTKNPNIEVVNADICNINFETGRYDLVLLINILHFIDKEEAIKVIERAKCSLKPSGIMVISILLDNGKFRQGELTSLFVRGDYDIVKYAEVNQLDPGHIGNMKPHNHLIAKIIVRVL